MHLVGTIQGLAGESELVEFAWKEGFPGRMPDAVAVGVPEEDVKNLVRIGDEGKESFLEEELDTGSYEESLLPQLARFGAIAVPPDDLVAAERLARETDTPLAALDLSDHEHADLYVQLVSGLQMIRGQMRLRKFTGGRAEDADSPEELMLQWDRVLTDIKGYRKLEEAREERMAEGIKHLIDEQGKRRVLGVVPYARLPGVAERLSG